VNVTKLANELEYIVTSNYRDLYLKVDTTLLQAAKMLRQQQAEIDIVKKLLCDEQIPNEVMAHWNPLHSTLASRLRKANKK